MIQWLGVLRAVPYLKELALGVAVVAVAATAFSWTYSKGYNRGHGDAMEERLEELEKQHQSVVDSLKRQLRAARSAAARESGVTSEIDALDGIAAECGSAEFLQQFNEPVSIINRHLFGAD